MNDLTDHRVPATGRWYSRGYLPHFDPDHHLQSVTFRFDDSLPEGAKTRLAHELSHVPFGDLNYRRRLDALLDKGIGTCWFRDPRWGRRMDDILRHEDGICYELRAWVIMPNHVHVL